MLQRASFSLVFVPPNFFFLSPSCMDVLASCVSLLIRFLSQSTPGALCKLLTG